MENNITESIGSNRRKWPIITYLAIWAEDGLSMMDTCPLNPVISCFECYTKKLRKIHDQTVLRPSPYLTVKLKFVLNALFAHVIIAIDLLNANLM